jgi:hypothetical protein
MNLHALLRPRKGDNIQDLPSATAQTEIVLLLRSIELIKSADSLSLSVQYCAALSKTLLGSAALSLSAHWKTMFPELTSIVQVEASADPAQVLLSFPELQYLLPGSRRRGSVSERLHDPLGVVHILVDFAEDILTRAQPADRHAPLLTLLLIGIKSGRVSIILKAALLYLRFKETLVEEHAVVFKDILVFLEDKAALSSEGNHLQKGDSLRPCVEDETTRGILLTFGKSDHGKLGHGDSQIYRSIPTVVETLEDIDVTRIASMSTYSLAVSREGVPFVWGTGGSTVASHAQRADIFPQMLDALPAAVKVRDVTCGLGHALFLTSTGRIFAWGNGGNGRLGLGTLVPL